MIAHQMRLAGAIAALTLGITSAALPQPAPPGKTAAEPPRQAYRFVSRHTVQIGGHPVSYTATVEETFALNDKGQRAASLVSFSYVRTDVRDTATRPIIFAFNGGPGSSSVWTHIGLLGPRRVLFDDDVSDEEVHPRTEPPFRIGDNPDSLLDVADIVLFDPPGTGFSRVLIPGEEGQFYGVQQDARVTSDFIRDWIARNNRWNAPRFLMGESYGTVRAAVVARALAGGPMGSGRMDGTTLNGVILLGQAMNMSTSGDTAALTALPTLAATAWYQGKVAREGRTLAQQVDEARAFAASDLARALYLGARLGAPERDRIADRIAALTGLSKAVVLAHGLRIDTRTFASELLKTEGRQIGLYDGRFTLPLSPSGGDPVADDPAMAQYVPSFVAALNDYLHGELGVDIDAPYDTIEFRNVNGRWDYGLGPGIPPSNRNFAEDLAIAMRRNPELKLFVGCGYYDLVTTLGSAEYVLAHTEIDPHAVTMKVYPSGHMPYIGVQSRKAVAADLRQFVLAAAGTSKTAPPSGPGAKTK